MFSYHKIVFGLKHYQQIYAYPKLIELIRTLRTIISEHDASDDDCERPGLHYHGIIEHEADMSVDKNDAVVQMKTYCLYFKIEYCSSPRQLIEELTKSPKRIMIIEIARSYNLITYYSEARNVDTVPSEYEQERSKMIAMENIATIIWKRKIYDPEQLLKLSEKHKYNWTPDQHKNIVMDSINLVRQKIIHQSIIELCDVFPERSEMYLTLVESIDFILNWCQYQNIDIKTFIMDWVKCLDREVSYQNTLYFEGSPESEINIIICSIAEVSTFVGEVDNESTGYTYVWEECLEKRCIVMRDPVFDDRNFDRLENILKGIGTFVPHRKNGFEYLRPTPVILSYSKNRESNLNLQRLQNYFLNSYVNLKPYVKLQSGSRLLHPDWLYVMHQQFTGAQIDSPLPSFEDNQTCDDLSASVTNCRGSNSF